MQLLSRKKITLSLSLIQFGLPEIPAGEKSATCEPMSSSLGKSSGVTVKAKYIYKKIENRDKKGCM